MNTALLIGINTYEHPRIPKLEGGDQDVQAVYQYLQSRWGSENILTRINAEATRQGILDAFCELERKTEKGDTAFIYFSGHGTRVPSPTEFYPHQTGTKHEALVCYDSLSSDYDLADKEISVLISRLADKGGEVVLVFDCCHSGSITRHGHRVKSRFDNTLREARPIEKFIPGTLEQLTRQVGSHVVLSACSPSQEAWEMQMQGDSKRRGVFTTALLELLQQPIGNQLTYPHLLQATTLRVQEILKSKKQTPQIDKTGGFNLDRYFLDSATKKTVPNLYPVGRIKNRWGLSMGSIHGISRNAKYPIYEDRSSSSPIGIVCTERVEATKSFLYSKDLTEDISHLKTIFVKIDRTDHKPMPVFLSEESLLALTSLINTASEDHPYNPLEDNKSLLWTHHPEHAVVGLIVKPGSIRLVYPDSQEDLSPGMVIPTHFGGGRREKSHQKSSLHATFEALNMVRKVWELSELTGTFSPQTEIFGPQIMRFVCPQGISNQQHATIDVTTSTNYSLEIGNYGQSEVNFAVLYVSRHYQIEQINQMSVPPDGHFKVLDKHELGFPKSEPNLVQIPETFYLIYSDDRLDYLNIDQGGKLSEVFTGNFRSRDSYESWGFRPVSVQQEWAKLTLKVKLLKNLGKIGPEECTIMNYPILIGEHPKFRADVSISSYAKHMAPHQTDTYLASSVVNLGMKIVDFSKNGTLQSILEIHHIEAAESLSDKPLRITIFLLKEIEFRLNKIEKLIAFTLPEEIPHKDDWILREEQVVEIASVTNEGTISSGGREYGIFTFELYHTYPNPDDGRITPGKSLKIIFAYSPETEETKSQ